MDEEPCARCGIRIPRYELRMLESRLFCIYCFNELQDERRPRCIRCNEILYEPGRPTSEGHMCLACYNKYNVSKVGGESAEGSVCGNCGRFTEHPHFLNGSNYCPDCYADKKLDETPRGGGIRYAIAEIIRRIIGHKKKKPEPKEIPVKQKETQKQAMEDAAKPKNKEELIKRIEQIKRNLEEQRSDQEKKQDSLLKLMKIKRIIPLEKHRNYKKPKEKRKSKKAPKAKKHLKKTKK